MSLALKESYPLEDDSEVDDDDDDEPDNQQKTHTSQPSQVVLSRCWAQHSAHTPFFTGGKVTYCHTRGTKNLYGSNNNNNNVLLNPTSPEWTPFFLTPYLGDLCIVDANRGCKVRTIRKGCSDDCSFRTKTDAGEDEEDDEDDPTDVDADAIICYALAPNDVDLITASRNQIIRQYNLSGDRSSYHSSTNQETSLGDGDDGKGRARVQRSLGKSGHDLPITHMEFHTSSIFFATGGVDGKVKVWDVRGGFITHSFQRAQHSTDTSNVRGRGSVTSLQWCQDISKLWLAIGREDGTIQIHDLRQGQPSNSRLNIEHAGKGTLIHMAHLKDHVSAVTCMIWSPTLDTFFSAGRDAVINVWSISVQETVKNDDDHLNQHSSRKEKNTVNKRLRKEQMKVTPTDENSTCLSYIYKRIFTLPIYEQIEGMVLIPNAHQLFNDISREDVILATAGSKGVVRLWKAIRDTQKVGSTISDIVSWRQQSLQSAFGEKRGGYMNLLLASHLHRVPSTYTSDHQSESTFMDELIVMDAEHNISCIPLERSSSCLAPRRTIVGHNDEILDLKIIPQASTVKTQDQSTEKNLIAVATNSPQVRIFDLDTFSSHILNGHLDTVLSLDVSPCGRFLSTCGKDKTMRIWSIESSVCLAIARGHTEAIGSTVFSRKIGRYDVCGKAVKSGSGAFTITASNDNTVKRWNLPGASELMEKASMTLRNSSTQGMGDADSSSIILELRVFESAKAHDKDINVVRVAPNDSLVATGSQDKTVKIWDANDLSLRGTLRGHKRGVWDCQFSSYDRVIATSSGDKTVKLWSLTDYSCVRTFQGHLSTVLRVRFLCGGLQLVSSGSDGLVKLWTIRTNECEGTMDGHRDKIWALDLSPDGTTLVSGGADSKIAVWKDVTMELQEEKRVEEEKNILLEQKLSNHLRYKEYKEALNIALEMDKPRQALKVFVSIIESETNALSSLQKYIKTWSMDRISQVLRYCREWNTRARNSNVSMTIINAIFTAVPANQLVLHESIPEILAGIIPYAERHFDRIDKLSASAYLVDFALSAMGILFTDDSEDKDNYTTWVSDSKLVLPEKKQDVFKTAGDGKAVNAQVAKNAMVTDDDDENRSQEDDEIVTVGGSSSSDDNDSI